MGRLSLLVLTSTLSASGFAAEGKPFTVYPKDQMPKEFQSSFLLRTERHVLVRSADATDADFRNLYWVDLGKAKATQEKLRQAGDVVEFHPGEFAVLRAHEDNASELAESLHAQGTACGLLFKMRGDSVSVGMMKPDPQAVIGVDQTVAKVRDVMVNVDADRIRATIEDLSSMFSRYHESAEGKGVAAALAETYQAMAAGRSDVSVRTYSHGSETPQDSLVVRIEGSTRPDEIVILGSHIDSISFMGGNAPGADDNASGTATNLEIFRVIMETGARFERTIEIHGYAAEEIGLVGSQLIAEDYKKEGKNVVAMVQHDMNLYRSGSSDGIWLVSNNTNAKLNEDLEALAGNYVGVRTARARLFGGSSDHASWNRLGFAAAFPFENPQDYNENIHSAKDTIANSGAFTQAAAFAKLGYAYLGHYAGIQ